MAATISGHVSDFVLGLDDSKSEIIAKDLFDRKITLVQVVECLGEFLTNPDQSTRKRGTQLLVQILQKLPTGLLAQKEVVHVTTFLMSKLSDHHSIQPHAVQGLAAVTTFTSFPGGEMCQQICSEIFKEIQNQSLSQADRRCVYTIFLNLLNSHLTDIQPMGDTFVCGFVQQMDGEKDPRNLMLAFRCAQIVCNHFNLGAMEEDMFEVTACYFPIDFVPPPNDPHGITREDLSQALCQVMASTPAFAKYCYPLLLEKLTSDVQSAKLQSLLALIACLPVYQTTHLQEYLGSLSFQLMREVRDNSSEELVTASLQALTALITQLSKEAGQLAEFMAETLPDLLRKVESDSAAVRLPTIKLLRAMAAALPLACHAVALEPEVDFLTETVALLQQVADSQSPAVDWSILTECRGKVQDLCDSLLASQVPQLQVLGMRGLCALSMWSSILPTEEVQTTVEKIQNKAVHANSDIVRKESQTCLRRVLQQQSQLADIIISHLTEELRANHGKYSSPNGRQIFDNSAALLASVAVNKDTAERVCKVFLQSLQTNSEGQEELLLPVSAGLATVLQSNLISSLVYTTEVIPSILSFLTTRCLKWPSEKQQLHATVLTQLTDGLRSGLLLQEKQVASQVVQQVCSLVVSGDPALLSAGGDSPGSNSPLQALSSWQQSRLVQLLLVVIPCLDTQTDPLVQRLLAHLPDVALQASDAHTRLQTCKCVAAIINRIPAGEPLESVVNGLHTKVTSQMTQSSDLDMSHAALTLLTWIIKGLVVRGHKSAAGLIAQLISLLEDKVLGLKAAEGFSTILATFPDVLCVAVRATVTPTFQQRFLVQNLPRLVSGFHNAQPGLKEHYLLAVASMLTNVPQQVLVSELPQLMPLLVSSLKGGNSDLHRQALSTLTSGIKHSPDVLTAYLSDILPDCLHLAAQAPSMQERILALRCVGEMIQLPPGALQPHKSKVLSALKPVLDDRKRLVRKEAVSARSAW
ncbi:hypothetical protein BaRGS_00022881 [Batillaria attramentaria]|uniref:MMS19 nucleotide excision repair protein n=1 Tax=Batillaria attramentaria TaxID=370345 RepID=A0ABD0KG05_9CAEN